MIKKIIALGVLLVMVLSFSACGKTDWQGQLDELNEKIERQTERITELEEGDAKRAEKIAELENEIKILMERIAELEEELEDLIGPGLESDFVIGGGGDPSSGVYSAYKTRKTIFKIDKVKIRLYYGLGARNYTEGLYSVGEIAVESGSGQEFSYNGFDNKITIKRLMIFMPKNTCFTASHQALMILRFRKYSQYQKRFLSERRVG